ncbi:MAG: hypothetical protein J5472_04610 [Clostridia bacterium]|nr:hypothetical protein [Clostridia bacterium]
MSKNESRESTWVPCPNCGKKTRTKVYPETVLVNFPLYCPKCKREMCVNIVQMKMMKATPEWCESLRKNASDNIIVL